MARARMCCRLLRRLPISGRPWLLHHQGGLAKDRSGPYFLARPPIYSLWRRGATCRALDVSFNTPDVAPSRTSPPKSPDVSPSRTSPDVSPSRTALDVSYKTPDVAPSRTSPEGVCLYTSRETPDVTPCHTSSPHLIVWQSAPKSGSTKFLGAPHTSLSGYGESANRILGIRSLNQKLLKRRAPSICLILCPAKEPLILCSES